MTIGEFILVYERNHVAFLKNRLGTSRRLHTYVGQLAAMELADLTKMQVLEWFHAIGQAKGGHAADLALQQLHSIYVKADEWELYDAKIQRIASRNSRSTRGSASCNPTSCPGC